MTELAVRAAFNDIDAARKEFPEGSPIRRKLNEALDEIRGELQKFPPVSHTLSYDGLMGGYLLDDYRITSAGMEGVGYRPKELEVIIEELEELLHAGVSPYDAELIRKDLKQLEVMRRAGVQCIFASLSSNQYVSHEANPKEFAEIAEKFLEEGVEK